MDKKNSSPFSGFLNNPKNVTHVAKMVASMENKNTNLNTNKFKTESPNARNSQNSSSFFGNCIDKSTKSAVTNLNLNMNSKNLHKFITSQDPETIKSNLNTAYTVSKMIPADQKQRVFTSVIGQIGSRDDKNSESLKNFDKILKNSDQILKNSSNLKQKTENFIEKYDSKNFTIGSDDCKNRSAGFKPQSADMKIPSGDRKQSESRDLHLIKNDQVKNISSKLEHELHFQSPESLNNERRRSRKSIDYSAQSHVIQNWEPAKPKGHVTQGSSGSGCKNSAGLVNKGQPDLNIECVVLYDFQAQNSDELGCKAGDHLILKQDLDGGWYYACNPTTQASGLVPKSYVDISPPSTKQKFNMYDEIFDDDSGVDLTSDGPRCYTLHDYKSGVQEDLAFCQGEIIRLTSRVSNDWLEGESHDGRKGLFPSSFVEIIEDLPGDHSNSTNEKEAHHTEYTAIALYDFQAENEGDLSIRAGDKIDVINNANEQWLYGKICGTEKRGIFPANFVKRSVKHNEESSELVGRMAIALFDYKSECSKDLWFSAGDQIEILREINADWLEGRLNIGLANKKSWPIGTLPKNYVQI